MGNCRSAAAIAVINFRHWLKDIRVRFLFLFIAYMLFDFLRPFAEYGLASETKCTPWLFPYLFHSSNVSIGLMKTLLHAGMLLLLCDAPFFYPATPYMVLRSKRSGWWIGESLYIILAAFTYTLFIQVMCIVMVFPVMTIGEEWGDVLIHMMYGSEQQTAVEITLLYEHYSLPSFAVRYLYPGGAALYSFLTVWGTCTFLGLLMYLVSLIKRNVVWGIMFAGIFVFLDPLIIRIGLEQSWQAILSPVTWTDIEKLHIGMLNRKMFMTIPIAAGMLIGMITVLLIAIWRVSRNAVIELK